MKILKVDIGEILAWALAIGLFAFQIFTVQEFLLFVLIKLSIELKFKT